MRSCMNNAKHQIDLIWLIRLDLLLIVYNWAIYSCYFLISTLVFPEDDG